MFSGSITRNLRSIIGRLGFAKDKHRFIIDRLGFAMGF